MNVSIPVFNGFLFSARAKAEDLSNEIKRKQLQDLQDNVARDVRNGWLDTGKAFERLSVTRQLREQANLGLELAQSRYKMDSGRSSNIRKRNCKRPRPISRTRTRTTRISYRRFSWPIRWV